MSANDHGDMPIRGMDDALSTGQPVSPGPAAAQAGDPQPASSGVIQARQGEKRKWEEEPEVIAYVKGLPTGVAATASGSASMRPASQTEMPTRSMDDAGPHGEMPVRGME